jgi:hypothetical protein
LPVLLTCLFLVFLYWQLRVLARKKYWRELAVFAALWLVSFLLSLLMVLRVKLPSPAKGIEHFIRLFISF